MARIKPQVEDPREKLLREGRIEARREMTKRFYARTPSWREQHAGPGDEGRVGPTQDNQEEV